MSTNNSNPRTIKSCVHRRGRAAWVVLEGHDVEEGEDYKKIHGRYDSGNPAQKMKFVVLCLLLLPRLDPAASLLLAGDEGKSFSCRRTNEKAFVTLL